MVDALAQKNDEGRSRLR